VKYDYTANVSQQSKPGSHGKTKINMEEIEADIVVTDERIPNLLVLKVELNTSV
jgi:hypothetical protein